MPEWIELEGLVFFGHPSVRRRLPEPGLDGQLVDQVADDLQSLREMLKVDQDWKLEAFQNHGHFSIRDGEERCLLNQYRDVEQTKAILLERFPTRRFVIVVDPLDTNTVYQATEGAPTKDDEEWEPNGPLSGVVLRRMLGKPGADPVRTRAEAFEAYRQRRCEGCKSPWRHELDYLRGNFPGARWADCPNCGLPNVVAVRTLRRTCSNEPLSRWS